MDIKTRNAKQDYGRFMTIHALQSLTNYMSKNNSSVEIAGQQESMSNISQETLSAIQNTFGLMFSDDKRTMPYNGQKMFVSLVIEDIFFNNKKEKIDEILAHPQIPDAAKKVFEDLKVTMPMYQSFLDMATPIKSCMDSNQFLMGTHVDTLKSIQNSTSNASEYFQSLKNGIGHDESFNAFMKTYVAKDGALDSWMRNQMWSLGFCENNRKQIEKERTDLGMV